MSEPLLSRQDIRERTGVPNTAINYYSREGLLVPAKGGDGSGAHRRFRELEVDLAALYYELQQHAGAKIGFLRELSRDVRNSFDLLAQLDVTPSQVWEFLPEVSWLTEENREGEFAGVHAEAKEFLAKNAWAKKLYDSFDDKRFEELRDAAAMVDAFTRKPESYRVLLVKDRNGRWCFEYSLDNLGEGLADIMFVVDIGRIRERIWGKQ